MKTKVKEQVLDFMQNYNTDNMNSNKFVFEMYEKYFGDIHNFTTGPSVESITRSRRLITKIYGIGKRTKADTQKEYINEFALNNKIHVI